MMPYLIFQKIKSFQKLDRIVVFQQRELIQIKIFKEII